MNKRILIIGLGSMGKRRVRNILKLNDDNIQLFGFDIRIDRTHEAKVKYGIATFNDFNEALRSCNPNIFIISTPPDLHMHYAEFAQKNDIHCFIEASVVDKEKILELSDRENQQTMIIPSATMLFTPLVKKLQEIIKNNDFGKILNINYHTGQFLEDWHPWEKISDYYVSKKETGGCREIVPFELTWLCALFGADVKVIAGFHEKISTLPADIDDLYHCILHFVKKNIILNLTIDVISRPFATRQLTILGETGTIHYSAIDRSIKYSTTSLADQWQIVSIEQGSIEDGYINPEEPYIEEMKAFLRTIETGDTSEFPNSLKSDWNILNILNSIESISKQTK